MHRCTPRVVTVRFQVDPVLLTRVFSLTPDCHLKAGIMVA